MPPGRIWLLISSPRPNPHARRRRGIALSPTAPRRQACLGTEREPKNRKGGDRFGSVDLIRLLARRTRSVDWRFARAVGPMDDAEEIAASFCRLHGASVG